MVYFKEGRGEKNKKNYKTTEKVSRHVQISTVKGCHQISIQGSKFPVP
jgi:hypothetical protein